MMTDDIPTAIWSGSFNVLGVDMKCHTLSDGQRIIEEDSVIAFTEALNSYNGPEDAAASNEFEQFIRWRSGR